MEEFVGKHWHRLISQSARRDHASARVRFDEISKTVGIFFRALGGEGGLSVEAGTATEHHARRSWLQRLAGTGKLVELGWRDDQALHLPSEISVYPERELNRKLYLWLAALATEEGSASEGYTGEQWLVHNQRLSKRVLMRYPGLGPYYRVLVEAELARRPDPEQLPQTEARQEQVIRMALRQPDAGSGTMHFGRPPEPVYLWLHPDPPVSRTDSIAGDSDNAAGGTTAQGRDKRRRRAQRVEQPDKRGGLILHRFESFPSWAEYVRVNREGEEEDDEAAARQAADDLEVMSVSRDQSSVASRFRFDLDLPAAASDDRKLGSGILLPEWDYKLARLRPDYCLLQPMEAIESEAAELPAHLRRLARRLRGQFEALRPMRTWHKAQPEGSEVDLDAFMQYIAERRGGRPVAQRGLFRDYRGGARDLACLLLADLSLSTDSWVSNHARVIDIIRDSLFLFAEALSATNDAFGIYGFSSRRRDHVRFHLIKDFAESYGAQARGRIQAIKPGYYTRMGAAIRQAGSILSEQVAHNRLMLILTDGKPNDLDHYEGRYGVEDTRMAILEARRKGLQPFCITIDEEAGDYLPHIFGSGGYIVIRRPSDLPRELPMIYARLTQ
ncbi:MAG: nitric oxide reductase [Acidithiobacillales bacterium SG8_45]|nr:MAG: nitric oxide reductase [Acidithiobacillales bacterium SG8_45]